MTERARRPRILPAEAESIVWVPDVVRLASGCVHLRHSLATDDSVLVQPTSLAHHFEL